MYHAVEDIELPCDSSFTEPSPLTMFVCITEALVLDVAVLVVAWSRQPQHHPKKPQNKTTEIIITLSQQVLPRRINKDVSTPSS
jgi:hypothetical protein